MLIDSHLHLWSEDVTRYPRTEVPYPASPETLEKVMAACGVDRAVFVLSMQYAYDNRFLVDQVEQSHGLLKGIGVIDPLSESMLDDAQALLTHKDVVGLRLRASIEKDVFCHESTEPLWELAQRHGMIFCILCEPDQLPVLEKMLEKFPKTRVVIDHFAHVSVEMGVASPQFKRLMAFSRFPHLHLKVSGLHYWAAPHPHPGAEDHLKEALDAYGAKRLMWGSDWPHVDRLVGYRKCLDYIRCACTWISNDDKEWILGKSAEGLFWGSP